jgi:hypothetical protein
MEKQYQYAQKIDAQISAMFQDDSENHIDIKEFEDGENVKAFFHALATVVPCSMWNRISEDKQYLQKQQTQQTQ